VRWNPCQQSSVGVCSCLLISLSLLHSAELTASCSAADNSTTTWHSVNDLPPLLALKHSHASTAHMQCADRDRLICNQVLSATCALIHVLQGLLCITDGHGKKFDVCDCRCIQSPSSTPACSSGLSHERQPSASAHPLHCTPPHAPSAHNVAVRVCFCSPMHSSKHHIHHDDSQLHHGGCTDTL
jgi:hypothetical protein